MSGHGFHVHGPHDHELEHAAHSNDDFSSKIAVMTAIMATVGALIGYEGGATQNAAAMYKNSAAIKKTEAANQWSYYQSKSSKQNLAELAINLPGVDVAKYKNDVERYKKEKGIATAGAGGHVSSDRPGARNLVSDIFARPSGSCSAGR